MPDNQALTVQLDEKTSLTLTEVQANEIAAEVIADYNADDESRQDWLDDQAHWNDLFYQQDKPLHPPWEGASDESMPTLAEACVQFHARAYKAMFPNRNIIQGLTTSTNPTPEMAARAKRVAQHMSWQLMFKDRKYKMNKDRLLLALPLSGSYFTKTYRDPGLKRNVVENVRCEDLVVPYGIGPRDMEDVERKTHRIFASVNQTAIRAKMGLFAEAAEAMPRGFNATPVQESEDKAHGQEASGHTAKDTAELLEQHRLIDLDGDGIKEPYICVVDKTSQKLLRIVVGWAADEEGRPLDSKRPMGVFTHYAYMHNPRGFYGLGQGHLIGKMNTAINKLLRQTIDAGTLANSGNMSGFVNDSLPAEKGTLSLDMGRFKRISASSDDINKAVFQFRFPGPNNVLPQVIEGLMGRSDRLATVSEALTGHSDKVMQPTALMALIEQGLEVFSTVYERVLTNWQDELELYYNLNSLYLDEEEYFMVQSADGTEHQSQVSPEDYKTDMMVLPAADPKMTTKQHRMAKADGEFQAGVQNPDIQNSPQHRYALFRRYYEAMEVQGIDEILPKPNTETPREDDPQKENIMALMPQPQMYPAHADQDHVQHIEEHEELLLAEPAPDDEGAPDDLHGYAARMTKEGRAALEAHVQEHVALMYGVEEAGILEQQEGEQGGQAELGAQPGDGAGAEGDIGALLAQLGMGEGGLDGEAVPPEGAE